jgi:hypothetical protein
MTQKTVLHIGSLNLQQINLVLSQISDRLDQIEGYRGSPKFKSEATFEAEFKYVDSSGTVIHSMGGT